MEHIGNTMQKPLLLIGYAKLFSEMKPFSHSSSGFTLIELMIDMTIFSVMSVMVMSAYFTITNTSRKLNATRQLSETAREITERISQDVREK